MFVVYARGACVGCNIQFGNKTMKRTLVTAAIFSVVVLGANLAVAQAVIPAPAHSPPPPTSANNGALSIAGTVSQIATIPAPATSRAATNASFSANQLSVTALADSTSHSNDWSATLQFAGVGANYQAKIGVSSQNGALKTITTTTDPASTNFVKYHVLSVWGTVTASLNADGSTAPIHI
jgi:hypothetical protein